MVDLLVYQLQFLLITNLFITYIIYAPHFYPTYFIFKQLILFSPLFYPHNSPKSKCIAIQWSPSKFLWQSGDLKMGFRDSSLT